MADMRKAEQPTTKPESTFQEMLNAIGDSLGDLASSDNGEDGEDDAASSALTTFGEPMETPDSVPGKLHMPQATSQPQSSHMRLGL